MITFLGGIGMQTQISTLKRSRAHYVVRLILVAVLLFSVSTTFPITSYAFNGYLEDCDFDGYDDETHAPVPWYGYDQTKGDPNPVPSDWDGVAGSYDPYGTAGRITTPPANNTGDSGTTNSNSGSSGSGTTNSGSGSGASANNAAGSASSGTQSTPSNNETTATEDDATQSTTEDDAAESSIPEDVAAVVGVKGVLEIRPENNEEAYTPGSTVIIKGTGFAANVEGLDIQINSDNELDLLSVNTTASGEFEGKVTLPEELETGKHDIVVLYKGSPIVKKTIEVEALATETASTTPAESAGINLTGIILLVVLAVVAVGAVLIWRINKTRKAKQAGTE